MALGAMEIQLFELLQAARLIRTQIGAHRVAADAAEPTIDAPTLDFSERPLPSCVGRGGGG